MKKECMVCGNNLVLDVHHIHSYKKTKETFKEFLHRTKSHLLKSVPDYNLDYYLELFKNDNYITYPYEVVGNKTTILLCPNCHNIYHRIIFFKYNKIPLKDKRFLDDVEFIKSEILKHYKTNPLDIDPQSINTSSS